MNLPDVSPGRNGYKDWLMETSKMELEVFAALSQTGIQRIEETSDLYKVWSISRSREFVMTSDEPEIWQIVNGKIVGHFVAVSTGPEIWRK